ncbi:FAD-dependent oxidoreductase [Curvibacter sp. CHRR-16]|uniref:NAD(P)/FAD-dependent oxidoreductase n=1 Tax=Curvibacter sp. CHRR-16 TaxID=2835872 RepID=UPI001BD9AE25|nr:FAD-dependent oxidoreductase [Curvibacter sp. CHRR-16]MBT0569345.1 FAD-dependent oxidoreductase [Curvibacter sp. CHRR-16]
MRVAIIGSGVAGLGAAHALQGKVEVSLFEAGDYFGGHAHTVDITLPRGGTAPHAMERITHGVDTAFLVCNERTYPRFLALLDELSVAKAASDMSFSVQSSLQGRELVWSGNNLDTVFAQRRNLLSPAFWGMLSDLLRFNRLTTHMATTQAADMAQPLGDFLRQHNFGEAFCHGYLLPMLACIWSCPTQQMLQFPVATMVHFCHNHGLLQIANRPQWYTVQGGSRQYVQRITERVDHKHLRTPVQSIRSQADGVSLHTAHGTAWFDKVIIATHSDQALPLLDAPTESERRLLGAIRYQNNRAVLHTDASPMPPLPKAWAAWNYERRAQGVDTDAEPSSPVCLHYWINKLQPLPWQTPVIVSLNPLRPIADEHVLGEYDYAHPVLDMAAIQAQAQLPTLQGVQNRYFCGAWAGYGFHEDGLRSGQQAAEQLLRDAAASPPTTAATVLAA